jgi:dipeptidyl aminopeptidase/acylaminoacyl peptidase
VKRQILDLEALLRVPYVEPYTRFDFSPDGTQIAFSWNPTGRWEIYAMPADGSTPPQQITIGPGAKFAPRWSPDGQRLAYVLDLDGGELFDIYLYDPATEGHTNLTPDTPDAIQPNFCWSPDGDRIAFISDRAGRFDTYLVKIEPGDREEDRDRDREGMAHAKARQVLSLPYPDWEVQWSPDGCWLAVVAEGRGQDYWTFVVPVEGSEPHTIGNADDPICAKDARWSPDGTRLAFASDLHGGYEIGLYELETRQITWATEGEGDKEGPAWSPDGKRLAYVVSHGPETELAVLELEAGFPDTCQVERGVHYSPRFTPDGSGLAVVFDSPGHPCDLWLLSLRPFDPSTMLRASSAQGKLRSGQALANDPIRQLTQSLPPDLQAAQFTMPTQVRYPSLDGQSVPALLYRPRQVKDPVPAVVYIHGGPTWLTQVTWDPLVQHMVSRGWAVLAPNYRGSTGYGREWQLANRFDLGGGDTRDVVAGADYLAREGIADPARIAVTGTSWGGYLTMTSLTQYPDRWAGGSANVPFLNWFTGHANSREDLQHWDLENFGHPEKGHDLYYERSPFFFLDRISAPVQMICGAHDVRCPASESIAARDRLVELGKECDLVLYADEGHGFLKIENVVDAKKRRAAFLSRVLEGD